MIPVPQLNNPPLRLSGFIALLGVNGLKNDYAHYSLDVILCDFYLFRKLKDVLTGQRFTEFPHIWQHVTTLYSGKRFPTMLPANILRRAYLQKGGRRG